MSLLGHIAFGNFVGVAVRHPTPKCPLRTATILPQIAPKRQAVWSRPMSRPCRVEKTGNFENRWISMASCCMDLRHGTVENRWKRSTKCILYQSFKVAGAGGFEPPDGGIKIRCLTTWRRPKTWKSAPRSAAGPGGGATIEPAQAPRNLFLLPRELLNSAHVPPSSCRVADHRFPPCRSRSARCRD